MSRHKEEFRPDLRFKERQERDQMSSMNCRFCNSDLKNVFVDLGMSPIANDYVAADKANAMEPFYPLCVFVCTECWLVQLPAAQSADNIFRDDYAYFSSVSRSWLDHAQNYVENMIRRFEIGANHSVVEVASNDGYLLQYFKGHGVPVLGIEPCGNVAKAAQDIGIPTLVRFFGKELASELVAERDKPDLIIGNNVLAHVPDLNDFVAGLKLLLADHGVITMEFPHLVRLIEHNQFDTIYHEHFSYFSLHVVRNVFRSHGLRVFDVEELATHGGSLRIYACHEQDSEKPTLDAVKRLNDDEIDFGIDTLEIYRDFEAKVHRTKRELLKFLITAKDNAKRVVGYGAPAKGNTLLNYSGIRTDLLEFTVDRAESKQGTLLPGTRIPVFKPDKIMETRPDYVLILPWNIKDEVMAGMAAVREWGGQFVVPIPEVRVLD
jgi:2-polyprenyl-3-methyl-5-hydroxy-6-metoxy-1,4-benzoquinol methylase